MRQRHLSTIIALGVALAFIVLIGLSVCVSEALSVPDSDDQCDYVVPPEPSEWFSWDGELNVNEFDNWEVLSTQFIPQGTWVFIKNPDITSPIKIVAMAIDYEQNLWGYRYFKDSQPYSFRFNPDNTKYEEYKFTQEERNGCMKCHQDKIVAQEAI